MASPSASLPVVLLGGTGNVGSTLARRLALAGKDVVLASRNPNDKKSLEAVTTVSAGVSAKVTTQELATAVSAAEALIIATPGLNSVDEWLKVLSPISSFSGLVLDATNPLTEYPELNVSVDQNSTSATEMIQQVLPGAKVYKAFNSVSVELMNRPTIGGKQVPLLYAGPADDDAKAAVERIISLVGFRPIYVGHTRAARNLESIAELFIHMSLKYGRKRDGFAFDLLQE